MKKTLGLLLLLGLGLLAGCQNPSAPLVDGEVLLLPGTWHADLDVPEVPYPGTSATDVWWEQVTATERYWVPENGAGFAVMGLAKPSPADCQGAPLSDAPIDGSSGPTNQIPSGTYLCGRTAEGRIAVVRVEQYGYTLVLRVWVYRP